MTGERLLAVAVGGAAGSVARYALSIWIASRVGPGFPWGTLAINATGSFLLCFLAAWAGARFSAPPVWSLALGAGFCGGYTTFSTFSLETLDMAARGHTVLAAAYAAASLTAGLAAGALGLWTGRLA